MSINIDFVLFMDYRYVTGISSGVWEDDAQTTAYML